MHRALVRVVVLLFAVTAATLPANARLITIPETNELMARADVVCNGEVIDLVNTLEKGTVVLPHYERNFTIPVEYWKAKIKVLNTAKGKVSDEIEVRFPQIDQHPAGGESLGIMDGPILISMTNGQRYRLFLKPAPGHSWYVGALDGDFDDGYAVQPLADIEPDDSPPPLTREEAVQCATNYLKKIEPAADISTLPPEARIWDGQWSVEFWAASARPHEEPAAALIKIVGNRQIDGGTWIADSCTTSAGDLKPDDVGRTFWIYMQPYPKDKRFYNRNGFPPMVLLGTLRAVTDKKIELSGVSQWDSNTTWPTLQVPIEDVHWYQRLNPAVIPAPTATR